MTGAENRTSRPLILPSASRRHFDNVGCPIPTSWARRLALIAAGPTILWTIFDLNASLY
jgi:hypothetical protein